MNEIFGIPANTLLIALLGLTGLVVAGVAASAWRHPVPFRLGIRNLSRRRSQTFLVVGGLALSTMIITSALGIGDTIDYSTKADVYEELGNIDIQVGMANSAAAGGGFSLGSSGPPTDATNDSWFDSSIAESIANHVGGGAIDAAVPAIVQRLPAVNQRSNLSEASVEIRGIGAVIGDGLAEPEGLAELGAGQVLVNESLARELAIKPQDSLLIIRGAPTPVEVVAIVPDGELAGGSPALVIPLDHAQALFEQPGRANAIFISNAGDSETGVNANDTALAELRTVAGALPLNSVKLDSIAAAESSAEFITTLFITFGTFSIFSGILLIFLIFSVLAAERQSELGMSRAVGQQRADLVRQFLTEGLAYNLIGAAVGTILGVLAAYLLAGTILELLGGSAALDITPRVSLRSVGIGYTLGVVITFVTVFVSAVRISRINIIAAIRNLDLPALPRESQWTLFLHPLRAWRRALQETGRRDYPAALKLFLLAGPRAVYDFWLGLLARGPVLLALGFAFAWVGVNVAGQAGVYGMGVAIFIIGAAQLAAWLRVPERLAYSAAGLALVLYWSLPTRSVGALAELGTNPGDFFISGLFLVGGAILLFLYNAEQLLFLFAGLLSRLGSLLPVARVSIAYPVAAKGRTATTLAMFSLIVFTLVGTATISNTFSNFLDVESGSGGYDIQAQTNPFNPVPADQFSEGVNTLVTEGKMESPAALAAISFGPVEAQSTGMSRPAPYAINGADDAFFATQQLELAGLARGYDTPGAVWAALQANPALTVIDNFSVDRTGDPTFQRDESAFFVSSIAASDTVFDPIAVTITGRDGMPREFTVIGVLSSAPSFYGALMNAEAAARLGYDETNRYLIRLPEGSDVRATANAIESTFGRSGLQTSLLKEQLAESRESINSIFSLLQGFVGLGLLIGISALGIVTVRAVVERRQQIGVLRAIGFHRNMVQGVFLLENLFVAGLGTLIGYVLALAFSYNLYLQVAADQGLPFLPPWSTLIAIGVTILLAALLAAWLHARRSARVVIAEALRYQG